MSRLTTKKTITSDRVFSLDQTVEMAWKLRKKCGVTRVADNTSLDKLGIPVVVAIRPGTDLAQITTCQGKGFSFKEALVSAIMEAVERECGGRVKIDFTGTIEDLGKSALVPANLPQLGMHIASTTQVDWVYAIDYLSKKQVCLPAADVFFPFYPSASASLPFRPTTTGLSSGNTMDEAVFHGILEIIERHAVSQYFEKLDAPLVIEEDVNCPELQELMGLLKKKNIQFTIVDLTKYAVIPTFKIFMIDHDEKSAHLYVSGQAAHPNACTALRKAFLEAIQSRVVAIQASREDLHRVSELWDNDFGMALSKFNSILITAARIGKSLWPKLSTADTFEEQFEQLKQRLQQRNFNEIYVTDLTSPDLNVPVIHVSIPGMIDTLSDPMRKNNEQN